MTIDATNPDSFNTQTFNNIFRSRPPLTSSSFQLKSPGSFSLTNNNIQSIDSIPNPQEYVSVLQSIAQNAQLRLYKWTSVRNLILLRIVQSIQETLNSQYQSQLQHNLTLTTKSIEKTENSVESHTKSTSQSTSATSMASTTTPTLISISTPSSIEIDISHLQSQLSELLQTFEDSFQNEPPFTLQRLCEILSEPHRYYNAAHKLLLALQKCIIGIVGENDSMKIEFSSVNQPMPQLGSTQRVDLMSLNIDEISNNNAQFQSADVTALAATTAPWGSQRSQMTNRFQTQLQSQINLSSINDQSNSTPNETHSASMQID